MFESLAAWVLNSYISEYFGNVNVDQLSIAIHTGEVELEGLPLRQDAFKHLGLPIEISNGFIGKISLKIPVYRLKSEPWVISIDELFLIARPITDFTYNEDEERQNMHDYKMSQLDSFEARWKAMNESLRETQSYYASSYSAWINYGSSFVNSIVENVQFRIKSLHIRYEDNTTLLGCPFACGIIIRNLSAHSTDENWIPKYINRDNSDYMRKLLELEGLSVYWDTNVTLFSHLELDEMVKSMRNHIDKNSDNQGTFVEHEYILAPVNGKAYYKRNCSEAPLKERSEPRNDINLQLDQFPVIFTAIQYKHIFEWSVTFSRANTAWKYRKWRPKIPISQNAKLWWNFAVDAHMEQFRVKRSRRNWEFVLSRARDVINYCDVYGVFLTHPESMSREMRQLKDRIEMEFSLEELYCVREIVFLKCNQKYKEFKNEESNGSYWSLQNWFPSWYNYSSQTDESSETQKSLNDDEMEEEAPNSNDYSLLSRDVVFAQVNFTINCASFALMTYSDTCSSPLAKSSSSASENLSNSLMELEFSVMKIGIEISNTKEISNNKHPRSEFVQPYTQTNLMFECQNLNILLLKSQSSIIYDSDACKLATASLNKCRIVVSIGYDEIVIDGLLTSLQVTDLITDPGNNKHTKVVSIGMDSSTNETISQNQKDLNEALTFTIRRLIDENVLLINIRMASLCYVHSAKLFYELTLCTTEFRTYMTSVAGRIKTAAAGVALGMVTKAKPNPQLNISPNPDSGTFIDDLRLDIYLESPVIILPTSPSNYEVLVAHLGHISLRNHLFSKTKSSIFSHLKPKNDIIYAEIRDLSLYSLDSSKNLAKENLESNQLSVNELYSCKLYGISILQETIIEISIEKKNFTSNLQAESDEESGLNAFNSSSELIPAKKFSFPSRSHSSEKDLVLTIEIPNICLRVSYNDVLMFWQIFNSLSMKNTKVSSQNVADSSSNSSDANVLPSSIKQLENLGFVKEDCIKALNFCHGNINEAAIWLTLHGRHKSKNIMDEYENHQLLSRVQSHDHYSKFSVIEVRIQNGILCLIDDCNETDVPLLELGTKDFRLIQRNSSPIEGYSQMTFSFDYYNSALSGWEPFIESCKFQMSWNIAERHCYLKGSDAPKKKVSIHIDSKDTLNINLTSKFMEIFHNVSNAWFEDIRNFINSPSQKINFRQRAPFIPFAIKNETGCRLKFHLVNNEIQYNEMNKTGPSSDNNSNIEWIHVDANETRPFTFEVSSRARHVDSHLNKSHKIVIAVDRWKQVFPVSVDKVGVYFREANSSDVRNETARIVFAITLEPKARKLITIRSALLLSNRTSNAMEIKFQNTNESLYINAFATLPIPLRLVRNRMQVRPCEVGVNMCQSPILWEHVRRCSEISSELQVCTPISITRNEHSSYSTSSSYRFCVLVERNNFPLDIASQGPGLQSYRAQPAHTISLLPPLQINNLLPYDLRFHITGSAVIGSIKSGQEISVHFVNPLEPFNIEFSMDNFPKSKMFTINPGATRDYVTHLEMLDSRKRILILHAQVTLVAGGASAIIINIYSPFLFVNRTGLPLIFKQEGASTESAGQTPEHEIARSISPLLFSYSEPDSSHSCTMRLGKSQGNHPRWCNSFYLEKGTWFRRLRIGNIDPRKPDKIYELGIDVRNGRDKYRDVRIVTISPRYQIENLSSYKLEFAQKFITTSEADHQDLIISTLPKSNVSYHWPRTDRDKLLCVRIASIAKCHWCGGFAVEPSTSFHLNIRDEYTRSHFIRVEILLQGATYFIVFTDANNLPPPIRIDNFSQVPVEFYQTGTTHAWMKTNVRPNTSVPYAWDESTLNPHITVRAPGGSCATYDMNTLAPGDQLTYENFIYIAFSGSFPDDSDDEKFSVGPHLINESNRHQLVFDVPEGSKLVFLNRKERGKRSQLWRMDNTGRLIHEGSSPPADPRDPRRITYHRTDKNALVLDLSTQCAIPGEYIPLMLRKSDSKRALTQTWTFTKDGRLCCEHPNLFVQPRGGFFGLRAGKEVVLGPMQGTKHNYCSNGIPIEQAITTQKMRKGSGVLSVSVIADGPTRVLRIADIKQSSTKEKEHQMTSYWQREDDSGHTGILNQWEFQLFVNIDNVGISIVSMQNEELMYIYIYNSIIDMSFNLHEWNLNCSVQNIQIDNQLRGAEKSVVLQISPQVKNGTLPAISITAQKLIVPNVEADVFKQVQISIKDIIFNLEEILLLKFIEFINYTNGNNEMNQINDNENQAANSAISSVLARSSRYYFTIFMIQLSQVKLSVFTSSHISDYLNKLKKKAGIKLIRFEDASIHLAPFKKVYALVTKSFLRDSIYEHYRAELKSQAAKILGSVDFLGNPLGFVNDVTDGLNELINEGSFGGLIWNVAHGISDSTAKVTSVLSDSLGSVTMDQRHQEIRKRIKQESNHHLSAGFKGLTVGLFGGMTSIISQTYEGAVKEGISGVFVGFGKGLVGTIAKPAVGMLDFATGAASAVRDTSRKISHPTSLVEKIRPPRVASVDGLLLKYRLDQAKGQEIFYGINYINIREENEMFIAIDSLRPNISVLITSDRIRFVTIKKYSTHEEHKVELILSFKRLLKCIVLRQKNILVPDGAEYYIVPILEESQHSNYNYEKNTKHTQILCENEMTAIRVSDMINCAKHAYEERKYLISSV